MGNITLASIRGGETTTTIEYQGDTAKVTYRPGIITNNRLEAVGVNEGLNEFLAELIVDWDVKSGTGKNSKKVPVTAETLGDFPGAFLQSVLGQLVKDSLDVAGESSGD